MTYTKEKAWALFTQYGQEQREGYLQQKEREAQQKGIEKEEKLKKEQKPQKKEETKEKIDEKRLKKEEKVKKQVEKLKAVESHSERVVALCESFATAWAEAVGEELILSQNLILESAAFHDFAKLHLGLEKEERKNHHKPEILSPLLTPVFQQADYTPCTGLYEVIACHKGEFLPTDYFLEASVLRICDKLDKFKKTKYAEALASCEANQKEILLYLEGKGVSPSICTGFSQVYRGFLPV